MNSNHSRRCHDDKFLIGECRIDSLSKYFNFYNFNYYYSLLLIQPNNLLKVLTAIVQSPSTEIDELIALFQVKNFDVIALNETWQDTQNKHPLAEVAIHGYKVFLVDKPTPTGRGGGSIMYVKNTLNPIERKSSDTCTREIIQVDINPKNAAHLKFVLMYRNTRIT